MKTGWVEPDVGNLSAHHGLGVYNKRLTSEQNDEMRKLLNQGMPHVKIAKAMGVPLCRVRAFVWHQREQRQMPLVQKRPNPKYDLAQEMWRDGFTGREIAEAYGYNTRRMNGVIEHYRKTFGLFPTRRQK